MEGSVEGNEVAATEEAGKDNVSEDEAAKKAAATKADEDDDISSDGGSATGGGGEGEDSDHDEEMAREEMLKAKLESSIEKRGKDHEVSVRRALRLVSCLIPQYKLNETDEILDDIYPACKAMGGTLYIKCIQNRAFNLYKQYRFKEALEVFKEQATHCGPSAALYENMAHTYNSLGDYDKAAELFTQAMALLEQGSFGKKGGILLGLGLVRERQGNLEAALPVLKDALAHFKQSHGNDDGTSLIAKAHMSVGQCYEKLGMLPEAEAHIRDASRIFKKTVGDTSPLTANSLGVLGRILKEQGKIDEAEPLLLASLELEVDKDAFHADTIWRLLNSIKEMHTEGGIAVELPVLQAKCRRGYRSARHACEADKRACRSYEPVIARCHKRIKDLRLDSDTEHPTVKADMGTVAVIYKTAGELLMLGGNYTEAIVYMQEAVKQLDKIKNFNCSGLIQSCMSSIQFMRGQTNSQSVD